MTSSETGVVTRTEILQQPDTWLDTIDRVAGSELRVRPPAVATGAGTSHYAAMAVAESWPGMSAAASTDLLVDWARYLSAESTVLSLARSGDSPESAAVVKRIRRLMPGVRHVAITCNASGRLATLDGVETLLLDPRTNDRSLVMTSSFTNLTLAGTLLGRGGRWMEEARGACGRVAAQMEEIDEAARRVAAMVGERVVFLASPVLFGAAREAALKSLEMTAGLVAPMAETYLGLRHGPMSFVDADTPVVCFLSSDAMVRRYELDLAAELVAKRIGRLVAVGAGEAPEGLFPEVVKTGSEELPDWLRTAFDIVFAQLLGYHLSLGRGLDPDNPSPGRVITRVVQGVQTYED